MFQSHRRMCVRCAQEQQKEKRRKTRHTKNKTRNRSNATYPKWAVCVYYSIKCSTTQSHSMITKQCVNIVVSLRLLRWIFLFLFCVFCFSWAPRKMCVCLPIYIIDLIATEHLCYLYIDMPSASKYIWLLFV